MKKIIVPCDFSTPSINAFRLAIDIATEVKGEVHLIHVVELPVFYDSALMPALSFEIEAFDDIKANALKEMKELVKKYKADGVKVNTSVSTGQVRFNIIQYAEENSCDLIVMGTHGAGGLKEMWIGSNAEKIVRTSPVPVITTKSFYHGPLKSIVFPSTLEAEDQEDLIQRIKELQSFFKAHLHIVWINTPLNLRNDSDTYTRLEKFTKRFALRNYTLSVYNHVNVEEGILQFAERNDAQMIAMGTHGRRGLKHLYNGSLAEDVVNHTNLLVWTSVLKEDHVPA